MCSCFYFESLQLPICITLILKKKKKEKERLVPVHSNLKKELASTGGLEQERWQRVSQLRKLQHVVTNFNWSNGKEAMVGFVRDRAGRGDTCGSYSQWLKYSDMSGVDVWDTLWLVESG